MHTGREQFVKKVTRRDVLRFGGAVAVTASVASCGLGGERDDPLEDGSGDKGKEAPMLADRVEAGELPPLEERLPANPLTVEPVDRIGSYGGTWTTPMLGAADTASLDRTIGYDYLVTWNPDWTEVVPNIAESWEVGNDGREFTFKLREGMKWSDGEPFTADDIVFVVEDILYNPDLYPVGPPAFLKSRDGELATVESVDDYEIKFVFSTPKGLFLEELAIPEGTGGRYLTAYPRHFLEQFHKKYGENVDALAKDEGFPSWVELFLAKSSDIGAVHHWQNAAELPTLFPWVLTSNIGDSTTIVAERNAYYWKVDPDGSQLPYIDKVQFDVVDDPETMLLQATSGDVNMHTRHFNSLNNKPVLAESREEGGYEFVDLVPSAANAMSIMLNLTHPDPVLREVFQNKDFRIGLSHAINRDEINTAVFQDQGEPWQLAPKRESSYFDEEFGLQYTEYSEDLANEHLDQAGYSKRDGDGFRLGPDGKRISFLVEIPDPAPSDVFPPSMELVTEHWNAVGIDARAEGEDRKLWTERVNANKHDAAVWGGPGGVDFEILLSGHHYLPYHVGSRYAVLWAQWYSTGGQSGEEPPAAARQQLDLYDKVLTTIDPGEREGYMRDILAIAKEQFYVIGTVQLSQAYGIVANDFHNVPTSMTDAFLWPTPGPSRPEQYFTS